MYNTSFAFHNPARRDGYSEEEETEDEWLSYLLETAQLSQGFEPCISDFRVSAFTDIVTFN